MPKDASELGALWIKQSAKGEFLSGMIEVNGAKINVVCFRNANPGGNRPDWRVLKSVPKVDRPAAPRSEIGADDVPFMWFLPLALYAGSLLGGLVA